MSQLTDLSVLELRDAIASGETSAEQAAGAYLAAIEQLDGEIGA